MIEARPQAIASVHVKRQLQVDNDTEVAGSLRRLKCTAWEVKILVSLSSSSSSGGGVVRWMQVVDLCVQSIVRNNFQSQNKIRIN